MSKDADVDRLKRHGIEALMLAHEDEPAHERPLVTNRNFVEICRLALQSLSQEAVRDEALEEVAQMAQDRAASEHDDFSEFAHDVRALKREPNAADDLDRGIANATARVDAVRSKNIARQLDVAEMVRRLENGEIQVATMYEGEWVRDMDAAREIAALLARLGQGWIPVSERLPEDGAKVLIFHDDSQHVMNFHANEKEFWEEDGTWFIHLSGITHWMPLPPAP